MRELEEQKKFQHQNRDVNKDLEKILQNYKNFFEKQIHPNDHSKAVENYLKWRNTDVGKLSPDAVKIPNPIKMISGSNGSKSIYYADRSTKSIDTSLPETKNLIKEIEKVNDKLKIIEDPEKLLILKMQKELEESALYQINSLVEKNKSELKPFKLKLYFYNDKNEVLDRLSQEFVDNLHKMSFEPYNSIELVEKTQTYATFWFSHKNLTSEEVKKYNSGAKSKKLPDGNYLLEWKNISIKSSSEQDFFQLAANNKNIYVEIYNKINDFETRKEFFERTLALNTAAARQGALEIIGAGLATGALVQIIISVVNSTASAAIATSFAKMVKENMKNVERVAKVAWESLKTEAELTTTTLKNIDVQKRLINTGSTIVANNIVNGDVDIFDAVLALTGISTPYFVGLSSGVDVKLNNEGIKIKTILDEKGIKEVIIDAGFAYLSVMPTQVVLNTNLLKRPYVFSKEQGLDFIKDFSLLKSQHQLKELLIKYNIIASDDQTKANNL